MLIDYEESITRDFESRFELGNAINIPKFMILKIVLLKSGISFCFFLCFIHYT